VQSELTEPSGGRQMFEEINRQRFRRMGGSSGVEDYSVMVPGLTG